MAQLGAGGNDVLILLLNDLARHFVPCDASNVVYPFGKLLPLVLCHAVGRLRLGQLSIIYSKFQLRAFQQFLHALLLVFHQRVERIEEDGLGLLLLILTEEVIDEWNHEGFRLTGARTRLDDHRQVLALVGLVREQCLPRLILVLKGHPVIVWCARFAP